MARPRAEPLSEGARGPIAALRARLANRPDSEHEQALVRVVNCLLFGAYLFRELQAGDLEAALAFYQSQFGWSRAEAVDMGPIGLYQLFATGGPAVGGMMARMPEVPAPFWLYYFNVAAVDAAVAKVTQLGGQVLMGPQQVPGGSWIVQCTDPQGALFAMVGPAR